MALINKLSDKDIGEESWSSGGIVTYTGKVVRPMNPDPSSICIEDVAHALANTCRYSGHCSTYYSVAEHCVNVSLVVPEELALQALLHDSAEAYLTDIPRPIKPLLVGYKEAENKLLSAILKGLGTDITTPMSPEIKNADNLLLAVEQFHLIPNTTYWPYIMTPEQIDEWCTVHWDCTFGMDPEEAEEAFLGAWKYLIERNKNNG